MDDRTACLLARAESAEQERDHQRARAESAERALRVLRECRATPPPADRLDLLMEVQARAGLALHLLARCREELDAARRAVDLAAEALRADDLLPALGRADDAAHELERGLLALDGELAIHLERL